MSYIPLWEIIENAQKGSGYTKSKDTVRAKKVLDSLAQKGWSKNYLKTTMHNLDDMLLGGWPEELFQESYMKETAQLLPTMEQSLLKLGVKSAKVRETLWVLEPLQNTRYTEKQLLDVAIEYILGHYKPIAPPNVPHFLQPDVLRSWIPYDEKEIMNLQYSCAYENAPRFQRQIALDFPQGGKVYYHASNWRSAFQIMNAIDTNEGRICLDFGLSRAFYVSESQADAIDWGVKNSRKWYDEIAIMVFYLPNNFQKDYDYKDLTDKLDEWKWVVTSFRNCSKENPTIVKYDKRYDFIYGPMLANPLFYEAEGPKMHRPPIMQLAAKTDSATRFLYKHMKGAYMFRKIP